MKLTSKARYGLKICCVLGRGGRDTWSIPELAAETGYTVKYIEKIMKDLRRAKLLKSERGAGGGYALTRPPAEVKLGDIIRALEGNLEFMNCVGTCPGKSRVQCPARGVWQRVYEGINAVLDAQSLQELVDEYETIGSCDHEKDLFRPCGNHRC